MSLVFTQSDLDNLKAALVSGANSVQIGDRTVTYRSQSDLLKAIRMVQEYLAGNSQELEDNPTVVTAGYSRGTEE